MSAVCCRNAGSLLAGGWFKECRADAPGALSVPELDADMHDDADPLSPIRSPTQVPSHEQLQFALIPAAS